MADPRFVLKLGGVELSQNGALTNPAFVPTLHGYDQAARVKPGDVTQLLAAIDTAGQHRPDTALPGVPGIRWSLDGMGYNADGAASDAFDATYAGVPVWAKAASGQTGPVVVDVTALQSGIVATEQTDFDAPSGTDDGAAADFGAPTAGVPTSSGTDAGSAADIGAPSTGGTAPAGTDAGTGADSGTALPGLPVAAGTDAGSGADTGTAPTSTAPDVFTYNPATDFFDTTHLEAATGGSGSASDTGTEYRLYSASKNDAALLGVKSPLVAPTSAAGNRRYTFVGRAASMADAGSPSPLNIQQRTGALVADGTADGSVWNGGRRMGVAVGAMDATNANLYVSYWDTANVQKNWNFSGGSAGSWQDATGGAAEAVTVPKADFYQFIIETDYNAGTPRFRVIIRTAAGDAVTQGTTAWVNFSWLRNTSGSLYVVGAGDPYYGANYGQADVRYTLVKCEAI